MTTIYLAAALFSLADREFNKRLTDEIIKLNPNLQIFLPQDSVKWLSSVENDVAFIFHDCIRHIDKSDLVLAILDGADADSGTCIELGYAYARGLPIVGIRTDPRSLQDRGLNVMVSQVCKVLITAEQEPLQALARTVLVHIEQYMESNSAK